MFHKEGYKIIAITFIVVAAVFIATDRFLNIEWLQYLIYATAFIFLILILQFFRNPKRTFSINEHHVVSPVDGKVVVIEEVFEKEYLKEQCIQVSVFMSPLNVHVTRFPVAGKVVFSKYHPGKYLVAWHPKASEENERTTVVVQNEHFGNVLHRQIAGALAKRIVNYANEDDLIKQADESGFIKFGSRVDVFLPLDSNIQVRLNQKVKGGVDVLATAHGTK